MDFQESIDNASYAYCIGLLKMLLEMKKITREEFNRISAINAEYYGTDVFCV